MLAGPPDSPCLRFSPVNWGEVHTVRGEPGSDPALRPQSPRPTAALLFGLSMCGVRGALGGRLLQEDLGERRACNPGDRFSQGLWEGVQGAVP